MGESVCTLRCYPDMGRSTGGFKGERAPMKSRGNRNLTSIAIPSERFARRYPCKWTTQNEKLEGREGG